MAVLIKRRLSKAAREPHSLCSLSRARTKEYRARCCPRQADERPMLSNWGERGRRGKAAASYRRFWLSHPRCQEGPVERAPQHASTHRKMTTDGLAQVLAFAFFFCVRVKLSSAAQHSTAQHATQHSAHRRGSACCQIIFRILPRFCDSPRALFPTPARFHGDDVLRSFLASGRPSAESSLMGKHIRP